MVSRKKRIFIDENEDQKLSPTRFEGIEYEYEGGEPDSKSPRQGTPMFNK
jgi:hypothetical protein